MQASTEYILYLGANCNIENDKIRQLKEIECIIKDLNLKIDNQMIFKDNIYIFHHGYQLFNQFYNNFYKLIFIK